jgi:hypothetical protein
MHRARKLAVTVLLLACAAMQPACSNGFTADGPAPSASETSKKFWDRCLGTQCPPMNSDDGAPKRKEN